MDGRSGMVCEGKQEARQLQKYITIAHANMHNLYFSYTVSSKTLPEALAFGSTPLTPSWHRDQKVARK